MEISTELANIPGEFGIWIAGLLFNPCKSNLQSAGTALFPPKKRRLI